MMVHRLYKTTRRGQSTRDRSGEIKHKRRNEVNNESVGYEQTRSSDNGRVSAREV